MKRLNKTYTDDEIAGIIAMRKNGKTAEDIAKAYGRTAPAILALFSRLKKKDETNNLDSKGRHRSGQKTTVILDEKEFNNFLYGKGMTKEDANMKIHEAVSFWTKVFTEHGGEVPLTKIDYLISKIGCDSGEILPTLIKKETIENEMKKDSPEERKLDYTDKFDEIGRAILLIHEDIQKIYGLLK